MPYLNRREPYAFGSITYSDHVRDGHAADIETAVRAELVERLQEDVGDEFVVNADNVTFTVMRVHWAGEPAEGLNATEVTAEWGTPPRVITEFLLARIAEDEAVVRRNVGESGLTDRGSYPAYIEVCGDDVDAADSFTQRFNPLRVMAECRAKLVIIEEHRLTGQGPCATLRALASAYADHPDYDPEWRVALDAEPPPATSSL